MQLLILASQSPRRRQLIQLLGYPYLAVAADVDENSVTHSDPATNAMETAVLKAKAVSQTAAAHLPPGIIVAADTNVALGRQIFGKPADAAQAGHMLRTLRGQAHHVNTGLSLWDLQSGQQVQEVHTAIVTMRCYTDHEVDAYVATGDPLDKAGAYAIQHPQFKPAAQLEGCFLGVVGFSLCHLILLLRQLGVSLQPDLAAIEAAHQQQACPLLAAVKGVQPADK